jgi:hypothetical protein
VQKFWRRAAHHRSFRPAVAASFTALLLVAVGAFGGAGYAASVQHQVSQVVHVFNAEKGPSTGTPASTPDSHGNDGHHAGDDDDQYRPGRGCGDKNHFHARHNECHHHDHGHGHHPGDDDEG